MTRLVMLFRQAEGPAFELRYARNLDLLRQMPGVVRVQTARVTGGPAGRAPYQRVVEVIFEDGAALAHALNSPEGVTAGKDLMAFAAAQVEIFFAEEEAAAGTTPLTPEHLQAYLDAQGIAGEIVRLAAPTPTVPAAAAALGVQVEQIVKSVVFLVEGRPFVVYASGVRRVDPRKLADRLGVNRKRVRLADADQVLALTGYAVGTVPPVGFKTPMPAFVDPAVQQFETVYAGGGGINALLKISSAELMRVTRAEVVDLLRDEVEGPDSAADI